MMLQNNFGDLARTLSRMSTMQQAKRDLERYSYEVSSGQVQDVTRAVGANYDQLGSIERSIHMVDAYRASAQTAKSMLDGAGLALEFVAEGAADTARDLVTAGETGDTALHDISSGAARARMGDIISALNTSVGGRFVFSGVSTDQPPLASVDTILADLEGAAAGAMTASEVKALVDAWFDTPGGGFETSAYDGSAGALSEFRVGDGQTLRFETTASDASVRAVLKGFALAALSDSGSLGKKNATMQTDLMTEAAETLRNAQSSVVGLQANIGSIGERAQDALSELSAEQDALTLARSDLLGVDTYEAAVKLSNAEQRLEMIYTITARLSNLKLSDYLR